MVDASQIMSSVMSAVGGVEWQVFQLLTGSAFGDACAAVSEAMGSAVLGVVHVAQAVGPDVGQGLLLAASLVVAKKVARI